MGAIQVELREHDRRLSGLHRTVGGLSTQVGDHRTEITEIREQLKGAREDIGEIKSDLADARREQKAEMTWVRRGLWAAAGTFMLFFVAVVSLLVQILGGA